MVIDLASKRSTAHIVVSASSLTAFSSLTASIYLQILDNMGSRSKNIQIASAAETARLRTDQEKEARRANTGGTQGHAPTRELRRDIAEAQTGAARKKAAPKSSRGGGQSPAEAGRGTARGRLDFQEEDGQPLRRISGILSCVISTIQRGWRWTNVVYMESAVYFHGTDRSG